MDRSRFITYVMTVIIYIICDYSYLHSPVTCACSSVRESVRGARLTYVCIRGVKGTISTALMLIVGYADPPGDGSHHQNSLPVGSPLICLLQFSYTFVPSYVPYFVQVLVLLLAWIFIYIFMVTFMFVIN